MGPTYSRRPTAFGAVALQSGDPTTTLSPATLITVIAPAQGVLLVGDFVFLNASGQAQKSAVVANYDTRIGVVVGGKATDYRVVEDSAGFGATAAAAAGDEVLIAQAGVTYAIADVAIAAAGVLVGVGAAIATAGRVTNSSPTAGRRLGIALSTAAGAGSIFKVALALG